MKKPILNIQTLSVYISTTLVLLLLGIMGILFVSGQSVSRRIKENFTMTVIMNDKADEDAILKLKKTIDNKEYVLKSKYISKEDALDEARASLGADPIELLGENPYEAEIEISLKKEFSNIERMAEIEKELMKMSLQK